MSFIIIGKVKVNGEFMKIIKILKNCNDRGINCLKNSPLISLYQWKIWGEVVRLLLQLVVTTVLSMGLLYCINMFWELYAYTPMGQGFLEMAPGISLAVSELLDLDVVRFAMEVSTRAFFFCLLISAGFQFVYLLRYLYLPRKILGRLVLFGGPLAGLLAGSIQVNYALEYWNIAFAVALFPVLMLFQACFRFSHECLPEIGDIITDFTVLVRRVFDLIKAIVG